MADLLSTIVTATRFAGLGFARLVALAAQRAGVALFADISTFACIAFNDESALVTRAQFSSYSTHLPLDCRIQSTFE